MHVVGVMRWPNRFFTKREKIASAFIITGANIASQDLLFGQLAERLHTGTRSRFVRLRSSEAANVKAALKKIIQDATTSGDSSDAYNDEDIEVSTGLDVRENKTHFLYRFP